MKKLQLLIQKIEKLLNTHPYPFIILISGISGSGKTSCANKLAIYFNINKYEADDFFIDNNGNYNFDSTKLGLAHDLCQSKVKNDINNGKSCIVSNTSLSDWEIKRYEEIAPLFIIRMNTYYGNIHNLSDDIIDNMRLKLSKCTYKPDYVIS